MSNDNTCNGWTNYATWRINLEMIEGYELSEEQAELEAYDLGQMLREECEEHLDASASGSLALDYALVFISDVNWTEIAQSMIDNNNNN